MAEIVFLTIFFFLHFTENSRQSKVEGEISKSKWREILIFSAAYYSFEEDPFLIAFALLFAFLFFSLSLLLYPPSPLRSTLHSAALKHDPPPHPHPSSLRSQRRRSSAGSFIRERAHSAPARRALDVSSASRRGCGERSAATLETLARRSLFVTVF